MRRRSRFVKGIRSFSSAAVLITAQCMSFGLHCFVTATHSLLGGQHGEESEEGKGREEKEEEG